MWILRRNKNYFLFSCKLYSTSPVCLGPSLSSSSDHKPSGCCWVKTWAVASLCPWMCFGYVTSQLTIAKWHGLQELWEKLIWSSCSWKYKSSHFTSEKPEEIIILQKHINPRPRKVLTELIQGIKAKLVEILGYLRCSLWYPEAFFSLRWRILSDECAAFHLEAGNSIKVFLFLVFWFTCRAGGCFHKLLNQLWKKPRNSWAQKSLSVRAVITVIK